jgi:hypothetical protein
MRILILIVLSREVSRHLAQISLRGLPTDDGMTAA